jgi:hypothetical protein
VTDFTTLISLLSENKVEFIIDRRSPKIPRYEKVELRIPAIIIGLALSIWISVW